MRRKPAYPALAALLLTLALAGCQQEPLPASGDAIRFSVSPAEVSVKTRADVPPPLTSWSYLNTVGNTAVLYGSCTDGTTTPPTTTTIFDGESPLLKCTAATEETDDERSATWSYTSEGAATRYWDKRCTYDFRAVFPANKVSVTSGSSSQVDVSYAMASGYDLMVASATGIDAATRTTNTVSLPFQHACAAVRILFTDGDNNYFLKSFQLKNIVTEGTLNYGAATPWSLSATDTYQWKLTSWEIPAPDTEGLGAAPEGWYYVIPQSLSATGDDAAVISFTYTVGQNGTQNIPVTLKLNTSGSDSNITKWEAGKTYTYKISIQANEIIFTVSFGNWGANVNTEYEPIG